MNPRRGIINQSRVALKVGTENGKWEMRNGKRGNGEMERQRTSGDSHSWPVGSKSEMVRPYNVTALKLLFRPF